MVFLSPFFFSITYCLFLSTVSNFQFIMTFGLWYTTLVFLVTLFFVIILIQAETWDPLLQCCNACTWTHVYSSNNKNKRTNKQQNYKGQKITVCMRSRGKFWTRHKKTKKVQLPLLKSQEQKTGCWEQKQGTEHALCTQHHQRGGQTT